MQLY